VAIVVGLNSHTNNNGHRVSDTFRATGSPFILPIGFKSATVFVIPARSTD
jgi:hypothetical protein